MVDAKALLAEHAFLRACSQIACEMAKEPHERDLQSGSMAKALFLKVKKANLSEIEIWNGLLPFCLVQGRSWRLLNQPEGYYFDLTWPLLWFAESLPPDQKHQISISLKDWPKLIEEHSRNRQREDITRFCNWIEAWAAWEAYSLYKTNKNCFQKDDFASLINQLVEQLNGARPSISNREREDLFQAGGRALIHEYGKNIPTYEAAKLHHPKPAQRWQHERLDGWLFRIWPLVKHKQWTVKQILSVLHHVHASVPTHPVFDDSWGKNPFTDSKALDKHLGAVLGLRCADMPKGVPESGDKNNLPSGWQLSLHLL